MNPSSTMRSGGRLTMMLVLARLTRTRIAPLTLMASVFACSRPDSTAPPHRGVVVPVGATTTTVHQFGELPESLTVLVKDAAGRPVHGARVRWRITSGPGMLASGTRGEPFRETITESGPTGLTTVLFHADSLGVSRIDVETEGDWFAPAPFEVATVPAIDVTMVLGPLFDCTPPQDPSAFRSPHHSSAVVVAVGGTVRFVYAPYLSGCTAHIRSTSNPPGGVVMDSGIIGTGAWYHFTPNVAGTWEMEDAIGGARGTLIAR